MHLGLLSQERLSFDPIKPLILRGPPAEDSSSVFTGSVVLSLAKATRITSITVTFKSTATTYWPEGKKKKKKFRKTCQTNKYLINK